MLLVAGGSPLDQGVQADQEEHVEEQQGHHADDEDNHHLQMYGQYNHHTIMCFLLVTLLLAFFFIAHHILKDILSLPGPLPHPSSDQGVAYFAFLLIMSDSVLCLPCLLCYKTFLCHTSRIILVYHLSFALRTSFFVMSLPYISLLSL